jgi:hypothetical protein
VHDVPIAPLTLLVGENSTGKSTFLALARLAWDLGARDKLLDFNEPPYMLGSFIDMINNSDVNGEKSTEFEIGGFTKSYLVKNVNDYVNYYYFASFREHKGMPLINRFDFYISNTGLRISMREIKSQNDTDIIKGHNTFNYYYNGISKDISVQSNIDLNEILVNHLNWIDFPKNDSINKSMKDSTEIHAYLTYLSTHLKNTTRPISFSPIRSKPDRTYNPYQIKKSPEGSHIPHVLSRLAIEGGETWKRVRERLEKFGKDSGLFSKLIVRHLGDRRTRDSDPFQIQIGFQSFKGKPNLVDVGYGISQVLPVILDSIEFDSQKRDFLLIQQPEVHLHPRAQAELGTFYFNEIKPNKRILIETHSDHLIDRVRMEARDAEGDRRDNHKHVLILYFERVHGATKIHPIRISETGDLIDVPDGYRDFFMTEQIRFLGF